MKEQSEAERSSLLMKTLAEQADTYPYVFLYGADEKAKLCAKQFLHFLSSCRPCAKICITDAETFRTDCFSQKPRISAARIQDHYRDCDVLIMFNVEKISGMYFTQERLYGLFDELCESGKQILIFSACAPYEIRSLERRNLAQFEGCLVWEMNEFIRKAGD